MMSVSLSVCRTRCKRFLSYLAAVAAPSRQSVKEMLLARSDGGRGRRFKTRKARREGGEPVGRQSAAVIHRHIALTQHRVSICAKSCACDALPAVELSMRARCADINSNVSLRSDSKARTDGRTDGRTRKDLQSAPQAA